MSLLVSCSANHIVSIAAEPDAVPRCTIDQVLEAMDGCQGTRERGNKEDSDGSIGSRADERPASVRMSGT